MEAVGAAEGCAGDEAACSTEGHQGGKGTHSLQVRRCRSRGFDPAETVTDEGRTHETHMGVDRRVAVHSRFRAHPTNKLNRTDRDTRPSGDTSQNCELRHAAILASAGSQGVDFCGNGRWLRRRDHRNDLGQQRKIMAAGIFWTHLVRPSACSVTVRAIECRSSW